MVSAWQLDVERVVVTQPASTATGGGTTRPASTGMFGRLVAIGGTATDVDAVPEPPPLPLAPPLALPQQLVSTSGTHVKWSPQSEVTVQGRSYFGTHKLGSVVVVHVGAVGAGHGASLLPQGGDPGVEQVWYESAWHTMPAAQSLSVEQGPGWHVEVVGVHAMTGIAHVSPGGQIGVGGHTATPET